MKGPYAKRRFGQNFLVDGTAIRRIVDALILSPDDHILEIGPGQGALTAEILERGASVTAIEIDRDLQGLLVDRFGSIKNFSLIGGDILDLNLDLAGIGAAKVVGNLPYNISTPILSRLITARSAFSRFVLMFQREVVDRLTASPGSEHGYMSVLAQGTLNIKRLFDLTPEAYKPAPRVHSSVVVAAPLASGIFDDKEFQRFVGNAFSQKRKTLGNNLKVLYDLNGSEIDLSRRAETLTLDEWTQLYRSARKKRPAR